MTEETLSEETLYLLTAAPTWIDPCLVSNGLKIPSTLQTKIEDLHKRPVELLPKAEVPNKGYIYHTQCKTTGITLNYYIEKKSYVCKFCGKDCFTKWRLARHERTHTGVKPFKCDECGRAFGDKSNLVQHMKVHTVHLGKPYRCELCGKSYSQSRVLKQHMRTHRKNGDLDRKESIKKDELNGDTVKHQKEVPILHYNVTTEEFSHDSVLVGHRADDEWKCDICGKTFHKKAILVLHLRNHSRDRLFECDACGRGFKTGSALKEHVKTHNGEKQWTCELCGKIFTRKGDLGRHMAVHAEDRVFQCVFCGKGFFENNSLKAHLLIHTGGDMLDVH